MWIRWKLFNTLRIMCAFTDNNSDILNLMLMATKSTRPKKGATRKAPPPPKRQVPVWMWLVVPLLVAGFVFVLVKLADVEPQQPKAALIQPAKPVPKPIKPAETPKPKAKAPEAKKETFEFYQILQDSEVDTSHVDAYQYEPRGEQDFYYMIQAASFRSNADADRLRAKLILSGLEAKIKASENKEGKTWYRVVVGPFETRSGESRAQDKLAAMGMNSYTYKVKKEQ